MQWRLTGTICLFLIVTLQQPRDADLLFPDVPAPTVLPSSSDDPKLEFVREFGDRDQGLVFGEIVGLAISRTGTLAVLDRMGCRVWVISTRTGEGTYVGGCGEGPGEFRQPSAITFTGDTLLVYDMGRPSIVKLTLAGEEVDRFPVVPTQLGGPRVTDLQVGQDGSVLAGLSLFPHSFSEENRQLVVFDRFGGNATTRRLVSPPLSRNTPRNIQRPVSVCVSPTEGMGEIVVALNPWGPQAVFLRREDLQPIESVEIPVEWARAQEHSYRPGFWGPLAPTPRVVCGDRFAVAGYRMLAEAPDGSAVVSSAAAVVFDLRRMEAAILGEDGAPDQGSALNMTPGAATGNRFFFFTNSFSDWPLVREYRIALKRIGS